MHTQPHTAEARARISEAVNRHHDALGYRANGGWKRCMACGRLLEVGQFGRHKRKKDGLRCNCRACEAEAFKRYYEKNLDVLRAKSRERARGRSADGRKAAYEAANAERFRAIRDEWRKRHPEKGAESMRRQIAKLNEGVVRAWLARESGIPGRFIPQELIEAKRLQLQIKRLLRKEKI